MTLTQILTMFRTENPEITERVITDALLKDWALVGDKEICAITRCIVSDATFSSVVTTSVYDTKYDLTALIDKFYDIDETYGGITFNNNPLKKTSIAKLDEDDESWRSRAAGTPEEYYRRGKYLYFDRPVKTAGLTIRVATILKSSDLTGINQKPYNELDYLEPFHYGVVKYLQWKAKEKVGKPGEGDKAAKEFYAYAEWMKKMTTGGKAVPIVFRPKKNLYQPT